VRLWRLDLSGADLDLVADALVLAPDAESATEAVLSHDRAFGDDLVSAVRSAQELRYQGPRVLDLHMWADDAPAQDGDHKAPCPWRVPYRDGLFHRPVGAALVLAASAAEAEQLVVDADPFEGHPFYGVPAEYGPAEPFIPKRPYVVFVNLDWPTDKDEKQ